MQPRQNAAEVPAIGRDTGPRIGEPLSGENGAAGDIETDGLHVGMMPVNPDTVRPVTGSLRWQA